jgi:hypothetical protein
MNVLPLNIVQLNKTFETVYGIHNKARLWPYINKEGLLISQLTKKQNVRLMLCKDLLH